MNLRNRLRDSSGVYTASLNDILFILLFFFLIIATLANPNVIKMSIPKADSDTKAKQTVVVSINPDQQFYVGTSPVALDSLATAINAIVIKADDAEPTVVINADKEANAESIVAVMRAAKSLNLRTVLAVDKQTK